MTQFAPSITVLMGVYNNAPFVAKSIDSILQQSFSAFEFIIIDDASTDETSGILEKYAKKDSRIIIQTNRENKGLPFCLNQGLEIARGDYIARQDGDDIAYPLRFEKQFNEMEKHPEIGVLGTQRDLIDQNGNCAGISEAPEDHNQIAWNVFWGLSFGHSTVLCRTELLKEVGAYRTEDTEWAEDLDLWLRLLGKTRFKNHKEKLCAYRLHPQSVSHSHQNQQAVNAANLKHYFACNHLQLTPPDDIFLKLKKTTKILPDIQLEQFEPYHQFLLDLADRLYQMHILKENEEPQKNELTTQMAFHLAANLETASTKQFLKISENHLPRWLYRFVRKYYRISKTTRRLLPGKPPKSFKWTHFNIPNDEE